MNTAVKISESPGAPKERTPIERADEALAGGGKLGALIRSMDWTQTQLGCSHAWPQSLRTALSIVLGSRAPILIGWGPQHVLLYNDAYAPLLGARHPAALGKAALEVWPQTHDVPRLEHVTTTGETTSHSDGRLFVLGQGFLEERYFTSSHSPIRVESGDVGGVFTVMTETTDQVMEERRRHCLQDLAVATTGATEVDEACQAAARAFQPNLVPFCLIYVLDETGQTARRAAASALDLGPRASPTTIDLASAEAVWPLAQARDTGKVQHVGDLEGKFGTLFVGDWPAPLREAIVVPMSRPNEAHPFAFLVAGLHPGHPLNESHRTFFEFATRQVSRSMTQARTLKVSEARDQALAALEGKRKDEFLAMLAHELRTPLTALSTALDLLGRRDVRDASEHRIRAVCGRQLGNLVRLVDDLLDVSRVTRGKLQLRPQRIDLVEVIQAALQTTRPQFEKRRHRVALEMGAGSLALDADPTRLEQVFTNLLSNAAKYTDDLGLIEVRLRPEGEGPAARVCVEITDSGRGLAPGMIDQIFELFAQVDSGLARSDAGLGIGLTLVRSLVELHGGQVYARSQGLGYGTTMVVRLPLPVAGATVRLPAAASNPALLERRRIVLVEDNKDAREVLRELLEDLGHEVIEANNGTCGRDLIVANRPDLALVDIGLPGLDGYEVAREIRNQPALAGTRLVALTGYGDAESRARALKAGFDAHLTKPFSIAQIHSVLAATPPIRLNSRKAAPPQ